MMDTLEALQEEREKHPDAKILVAAMNDWRWDDQTTIRRNLYVAYESFLYWEGNAFYDDYDDCVQDLMEGLDLTEGEAKEHIEKNGYEDAIVIYTD